MSYVRALQALANEYFRSHPDEESTARDIARWALITQRLKPRPDSAERQLADDLSRAMREEYTTDPQGRRVRAKHVARKKRQGVGSHEDSPRASHEHSPRGRPPA